MKLILFFFGGLAALAATAPKQPAEAFFKNYEFKKALTSWSDLYKKHPNSWEYAEHVADLQLLLEGRAKSQETLRSFLSQKQNLLTTAQQKEISKKIMQQSETFLFEEAQTHYLQALSKSNLKEWSSSLPPITQAAALEPDNLKVLSLKYEIEKHLELYAQAYETLKAIHTTDIFSTRVVERLAESHIFYGKFSEARLLLEKDENKALSPREKLALAVSLWELGDQEESKKLVSELAENKKSEIAHHPATLWMLYRIASENKAALKTFLKSSEDKTLILIDGWDPYRLINQRTALAK